MNQSTPRIGVLLAQLGTPDAPTPAALRRYLREFLGDPRVVERNRLLWWFILRLIVLPRRPRRSAALYQRVWTRDGSPLLIISRAQARGLQASLDQQAPGRFKVALGMRYGNPPMASALKELVDWGAEQILLFPAYPQYAGPTTASTYDEAFRQLATYRYVPTLRVVPPYYTHPGYIGPLADSVRETTASLSRPVGKILVSFHGIPQSFVDNGDPYAAHCQDTAKALAAKAGWADGAWQICYQSRAGREPWLLPNTDDTLMELGRSGVRDVMVICPGFVADCLETIDEIGMVGLEQFREAGGETLTLVPGLNDRPGWIDGMTRIVIEQAQGWSDLPRP